MRIIRVHNYYQQPGGEDQSVAAEIILLQQHGHEVIPVTLHNNQIKNMKSLSLAVTTIWNQTFYYELRTLVRRVRPTVVHFENTFPLVSPAAYYAVRSEGIPVVQTLHNYRLFCANAYFLRNGRVCEDCLGKAIPWPALRYRCYRDSLLATGVVTTMQIFHRVLGSWRKQVDRFIALTEFSRQKFIAGGLPAAKIVVKPNFLATDPGIGAGNEDYALFVGRLSPEKGLDILLKAWQKLGQQIPLRIVGAGPLAEQVDTAAIQTPGVVVLGSCSNSIVLDLMRHARLLIFPSLWYEGFPRVILEALAVGLPVVASNLGSMSSLIEHKRTGLHFRPGDVQDLIMQIEWLLEHPDRLKAMREACREEFTTKYTAEKNYRMLIEIYEDTIYKNNVKIR